MTSRCRGSLPRRDTGLPGGDTRLLPEWADPAKIKRGQELFETWGLKISMCLFCASLPSAYAAAKGVQVLHLTAQLETKPHRRVMETGQFLMNVLTVGGFERRRQGLSHHSARPPDARRRAPSDQGPQRAGSRHVGCRLGHPDQPGGPRRTRCSPSPICPSSRCAGWACGFPTRMSRHTCICGTSSRTCSDSRRPARARHRRCHRAGRDHPAQAVQSVASRAGDDRCADGPSRPDDARAPVRQNDPAVGPSLVGDKTADMLDVPRRSIPTTSGGLPASSIGSSCISSAGSEFAAQPTGVGAGPPVRDAR